MKKNFLITTGGSGGHVIPATILYDHLSSKANVIISTDERGLKYFNRYNYKYTIINTPKLGNIFVLPFNLLIIFSLIFKSLFLLKKNKITKIFSTGGYMSIPLIFAAKILNIKIYLLEPNQVIGRANKIFLKFCENIFCYSKDIKNFPKKFNNKMIIIYPLIKEHIYNLKPKEKINEKFTLLVVGGSQGASIFNNNLKNSFLEISKKFPIKIIQQTNKSNIPILSKFYKENDINNIIFDFEENFSKIIHQADLCITRAGSSTLAELSFLNTPFIAVPLPTSKDNHQFENANFYKKNNCCWLIDQKDFDEKIQGVLEDIFKNKTDYLEKKENLKKLNYQNTWINVNQKILKNINEN